jgi:hypothetical protein
METILAFIWAPIVLYAVTFALGLLAEGILRTRFAEALVAPVGLAILISLVMPLYRLGAGSGVAVAATLVCAAAGLVLGRRDLRARINPGGAGIAALAVYALYMAPVVLTGHWTWAGYNFVNDTSSNFVWADLLSRVGVSLPGVVDSTTANIQTAPVALGYPMGAHALLATLQPLTGASIPAIYQPVIAASASLAAMAMTQLARASGLRTPLAALAGALPMAGVLVYRYALHGAIKEVVVIALLATAAALARESLDRTLSFRVAIPIALCAAALLHVFSAVGAIWALVLGILVLGVALLEGRGVRAVVRLAIAGAVIGVIAVAANLSDIGHFANHAGDAFASSGGASTAYMGHLLRPIPLTETAGVWLTGDYRGPVVNDATVPNAVLIALVGLLAGVGIVLELRRRRPVGLLLLIPAAVVAAAFIPQLSPYAGAKLLVILSPAVVLMAALGGLQLVQGSTRRVAVAAGVVTGLVVLGLAGTASFGFRYATLAPSGRIAALEDAADHAKGDGPWLMAEWEEYAKYFMRDLKVNSAFEAESPRPAELRPPGGPLFGQYYDLDQLTLPYVTSFPGIITRRSPVASRPPAAFRLVYSNDYYDVWRRRPGVRVLEHMPLQHRHDATLQPSCAEVRRLAASARPGDQMIATSRAEIVTLDPTPASVRPDGWERATPDTVTPQVPGEVEQERDTPAGRFDVWVKGSFGRGTMAYVDGQQIGTAKGINTPGQWLEVGEVRLSAGEHTLKLRRPGLGVGPGDAWRGEIGPLALEPLEKPRLVTVAPDDASQLCGRQWDWIEVVRG